MPRVRSARAGVLVFCHISSTAKPAVQLDLSAEAERRLRMQHHLADETASLAPRSDTRLVLQVLQAIQSDVSGMRSVLNGVERETSNNGQRLEAIEALIRTKSATSQDHDAPRPSSSNAFTLTLSPAQACAAASLLVLLFTPPVVRRTIARYLRSIPVNLLVLAQITVGTALLSYRGHDALENILGMDVSKTQEERDRQARRRQLLHYLLLVAAAALPAKGVAHVLAPHGARRGAAKGA